VVVEWAVNKFTEMNDKGKKFIYLSGAPNFTARAAGQPEPYAGSGRLTRGVDENWSHTFGLGSRQHKGELGQGRRPQGQYHQGQGQVLAHSVFLQR
jgi:hypothetical protein